MAIEGFDYKGFAASMSEQAVELVPQGLKDFEKEYIVKTLGNYTLLAGEALYNDEQLNLSAEQAIFITQIIAEWSFHKSIDLINSGILPEYWDSIMQKIAFTIFEISKHAIIKNIPQEQLLQAVEFQVKKVYKESIDELEKKGVIDKEITEKAKNQSNIDDMAKQAHEQAVAQAQAEAEAKAERQKAMVEESERNQKVAAQKRNEKANNKSVPTNNTNQVVAKAITNKELRLMSLALVLKILSQDKVTTILNKFNTDDSLSISNYMNIANLESQVDSDLIVDCINDIKGCLPVKRKLTKENVILDMIDLYKAHPREKIEKLLKNERPLIKRFASKAYDGEYSELPLKVAGVVADYIAESI